MPPQFSYWQHAKRRMRRTHAVTRADRWGDHQEKKTNHEAKTSSGDWRWHFCRTSTLLMCLLGLSAVRRSSQTNTTDYRQNRVTHRKYIHVAIPGAGEPAKSTGLVQHKVVWAPLDQNIDQIKGPIWWIINFKISVSVLSVKSADMRKIHPFSFDSLHFAESVR